jgi:ubiquinone/menaquinone biosynthesis C-methylase UbiE
LPRGVKQCQKVCVALSRTLEQEVMDTEQEARDYDAMDHAEVNARFCDDLLSLRPDLGRVLDVGTGTARIPIELCRRATDVQVSGIDLATSMLASAKRHVDRAGLAERIHLILADAKSTAWEAGAFDAVISNSIVHHIPEPRDVLREMWRLVRKGGVLFVRDLVRPDSADATRVLLAKYARIAGEGSPPVRAMHQRQRALFEASLHAALTVREVVAAVTVLGIPGDAVQQTSDRHWTLAQMRLP